MKDSLKPRAVLALRAVLCLALAIFCPAIAVLGWLSTAGSPSFGTSYPVLNVTTTTNLTDQTSKVREEKWVRRIVQGADYLYQECPLAEMMGEGDVGKAIVKLTDTQALAGNTVNVPTMGGFAGPFVQGEGTRTGNEQKFQVGNFQVKIGRGWFGVAYTGVARDETLIGGRYDRAINDGLRAQHAKKRNDDMLMTLIAAAGSTGRNILFPGTVTTRSGLLSASVVSTTLLTNAKLKLSTNGAMPMSLGPMDSGKSRPKRFMFMSPHNALVSLDTESAYTDARTQGGVRGDGNPMFTGEYTEWNSMGIYRWQHVDHGNWGSVGSPLLPRAFLGVALTGADTASVLYGGGNATAAAASPAPAYFEFFSNAPWTYHNGNTIAADTSTTRYLKIINSDGTGYGRYSYKVNDGKNITILARVSGGTQTNDHPVGSKIVETNANGVPFARSLAFGQQILAVGQGSINGSVASPQMGRRTEEIRNHGNDIAVGAEAAWGCAAISRADGVKPGFLIVEHAIVVEGDTQAAVT